MSIDWPSGPRSWAPSRWLVVSAWCSLMRSRFLFLLQTGRGAAVVRGSSKVIRTPPGASRTLSLGHPFARMTGNLVYWLVCMVLFTLAGQVLRSYYRSVETMKRQLAKFRFEEPLAWLWIVSSP